MNPPESPAKSQDFFLGITQTWANHRLLFLDHCIRKDERMDAINSKRKARRTITPNTIKLSKHVADIDKKYSKKPSIYAGSEEKMLNLVVEIIVKIIVKEVL